MESKVKKTLSGWIPADEKTERYFKKGKLGDFYHFDIKHYKDQRNQRMLQKYWVMLQVAVDNSDKYRTKEDLHHDIKWALDIVTIKQNVMTGEMLKEVGSVAMDKMDQAEFERFYSDAVNVIIKFVLTGSTAEELENRVIEIIGQFG